MLKLLLGIVHRTSRCRPALTSWAGHEGETLQDEKRLARRAGAPSPAQRERVGERVEGINPPYFWRWACASSVMGTNRTGKTLRFSKVPSARLVSTRRSCQVSPSGRTILPPTLSWSR